MSFDNQQSDINFNGGENLNKANDESSLPLNENPGLLSFSQNTTTIVSCLPNGRATIFVKINCDESFAEDIFPLEFEWFRGKYRIEKSDRFRITETGNSVQLAIEHVKRDDAGFYTLTAKTKRNDIVRKKVELIVDEKSSGEDPPIFLRGLADLSVKVGTRTRLLLEIRSSTDVKLTWFKNERRIWENDRLKQINEGSFHYLELNPVILEDGGQWMVLAENKGGRNSCCAHLNVLVPKAFKAPEFMEELRAVLNEEGAVSLECKVVGIPTPQLRWFKDSKEIKPGDVFALTANLDDPTSLGTYTCEAANCMGKAISSSKVHVGRKGDETSTKPTDEFSTATAPMIFKAELKDTSVNIGDIIIMGCQVIEQSCVKSVAWYNEIGRVEANERYKLIEDDLGVYMIVIKPSESCDQGVWKCVVTCEDGCVAISTCHVDMKIPKNYRKPRFIETLRIVLTEEGLVSFECKVVGFPTPVLKWYKDGQELKPGDVYQLTGVNSLGTYSCKASNCMGECISVAVLTVDDIQNQLVEDEFKIISENKPPIFVSGLTSQEVKINEPFKLLVIVKATPSPVLNWFRDELPIETISGYTSEKSENGYFGLNIERVEIADQAEWKCVAINEFGTAITSCFLKLQIPRHFKKPRFLECLRAVLTDEGAVNLECKVVGVPQPVLKWYKDGIEIKPGDIHKITSGQDGTCCLGTYTCEARNCMGIVVSSAALLGFEEDGKPSKYEDKLRQPTQLALHEQISLSTIQEENTSQLYETAIGDITVDDKGDLSFSFDGKEVSISMYETPDLTEEEAMKIVEMYADQISEHISESNVVELPPLRFVKETSQSKNLLMQAIVIDVSPEYFSNEEDLRTEADMEDMSINDITGRESIVSNKNSDSLEHDTMKEEFLFRKRKHTPTDEATEEFCSSSKTSSFKDFQDFVEESALPSLSKHLKKSPHTTETDVKRHATDSYDMDNKINVEENLQKLVPFVKHIQIIHNNLLTIEKEVMAQSVLMMTPSAADQSLSIVKNLLEPVQNIQSRLLNYAGELSLDSLFMEIEEDIRSVLKCLQVIEKCVETGEIGTTFIQRTSSCIVESIGDHIMNAFEALTCITNSFENEQLSTHFKTTADEIRQVVKISCETVQSQALLQEIQEHEFLKHVTDTVSKMQENQKTLTFDLLNGSNLPKEAEGLKSIFQSIEEIKAGLECVEKELSIEDNEEAIYIKVHGKVLNKTHEPIQKLGSLLEAIQEKVVLEQERDSLEHRLDISILDIISPPFFELKKGLDLINSLEPNSVESGKITVSTVESMILPLQEIQNGLGQLCMDIESGQLAEDIYVENTDTQNILKSFAKSVLFMDSNIDLLANKSTTEIVHEFKTLKNHLSAFINVILDGNDIQSQLCAIESFNRSIGELNECIQQIEGKSFTGLEFRDPLKSLYKSAVYAKEMSVSEAMENKGNICELMDKICERIQTMQAYIEKGEFSLTTASQKNILETSSIKNEIVKTVENLLKVVHGVNNQSNEKVKQDFLKLAKSLESLQTHINQFQSSSLLLEQFHQKEQGLKSMTVILNCLKDITAEVQKNKEQDNLKSLKYDENNQEALRVLKTQIENISRDLKYDESPLTAHLLEICQCLTDVSNTSSKSAQEKQFDIEDTDESQSISKTLKENEPIILMSELQDCIDNVISQFNDENLSQLEMGTRSKLEKILSNADTIKTHVLEIQNLSETYPLTSMSLKTQSLQFANVLFELEKCVARVQDLIVYSEIGELKLTDNYQMEVLSSPLKELKESINELYEDELHQLNEIIMSNSLLVQDENVLESLQCLTSNDFSIDYPKVDNTSTDQNIAAINEEQHPLSNLDPPPSKENYFSKVAKEDLKVEEAILDVQQSQVYHGVGEVPIFETPNQKSSTEYEIVQESRHLDANTSKAAVYSPPKEDTIKKKYSKIQSMEAVPRDIFHYILVGFQKINKCSKIIKASDATDKNQLITFFKKISNELQCIETELAKPDNLQDKKLFKNQILESLSQLKKDHTIVSKMESVESTEDIRETIEELSYCIHCLETQLKDKFYKRVNNELQMLISCCLHSSNPEEFIKLANPLRALLCSIENINDTGQIEISKSSQEMQSFQNELQRCILELNTILKSESSTPLNELLYIQTEENIQVLELLQELDIVLDSLNCELSEIKNTKDSFSVPLNQDNETLEITGELLREKLKLTKKLNSIEKTISEVKKGILHNYLLALNDKLYMIDNYANEGTKTKLVKSSETMVAMQKTLMEVFFLTDDCEELLNDFLKHKAESVKSSALQTFNFIENSNLNIEFTDLSNNMMHLFESVLQLTEKIKLYDEEMQRNDEIKPLQTPEKLSGDKSSDKGEVDKQIVQEKTDDKKKSSKDHKGELQEIKSGTLEQAKVHTKKEEQLENVSSKASVSTIDTKESTDKSTDKDEVGKQIVEEKTNDKKKSSKDHKGELQEIKSGTLEETKVHTKKEEPLENVSGKASVSTIDTKDSGGKSTDKDEVDKQIVQEKTDDKKKSSKDHKGELQEIKSGTLEEAKVHTKKEEQLENVSIKASVSTIDTKDSGDKSTDKDEVGKQIVQEKTDDKKKSSKDHKGELQEIKSGVLEQAKVHTKKEEQLENVSGRASVSTIDTKESTDKSTDKDEVGKQIVHETTDDKKISSKDHKGELQEIKSGVLEEAKVHTKKEERLENVSSKASVSTIDTKDSGDKFTDKDEFDKKIVQEKTDDKKKSSKDHKGELEKIESGTLEEAKVYTKQEEQLENVSSKASVSTIDTKVSTEKSSAKDKNESKKRAKVESCIYENEVPQSEIKYANAIGDQELTVDTQTSMMDKVNKNEVLASSFKTSSQSKEDYYERSKTRELMGPVPVKKVENDFEIQLEMEKPNPVQDIHSNEKKLRISKAGGRSTHIYAKEYTDKKLLRNISRPPVFELKLTNQNISSGSKLKLICSVYGNDLMIKWYKDNILLHSDGHINMFSNDGLCYLEILKVCLSDSGLYRCEACNSNGEVETSCLVTVYISPTQKFGFEPIFTRNIKEIFQSPSNELILECQVTGDPKPLIYWHKDHELLSTNERFKCRELDDGVIQLVLTNPTFENSGLYECHAKNELGLVETSKYIDVSNYVRDSKCELIYEGEERNMLVKSERNLKDTKLKLSVESVPKNIKITKGSKARITLNINGLVDEVNWFKYGERITKDKRYKILNINGAVSLEISDVNPDDSGVYKCVMKNGRHSIETSCNLTVYTSDDDIGSDNFVLPLLKKYDAERNEIILYSQVRGNPTVTWMRDDHTISNNRYISSEETDGIRKLIIRNPIISDCRSISCVAESAKTIETISTNIVAEDLAHLMPTGANSVPAIHLVESSSKTAKDDIISSKSSELKTAYMETPTFSSLLNDKTCYEGTDIHISCNINNPEHTSIYWFKDEQLLTDSDRYQTYLQNGKAILKINKSTFEDSGQYTCRISNEYGDALTSCQLNISKSIDENIITPTFIQSITDTYSLNENELVLDCRVRGKPKPEITWMKGMDLIVNDKKYQQYNEADGYSKLIISSPNVQDSGVYTCVARNEVSENKMTHQVDFKGREHFTLEKTHGFFHRDPNKPHFLAPLGNQTVCPGGTVAITAEFMQSQTPIEVNWMRDRKSVHGQPNVKTFYDRGSYTLAIMNAGPETEGTYTCRASNAFGRIESHATVDVAVGAEKEDRPPLFLSRPDNEMKIALGDPFSISFRIAGDPKPKLTFMKGTKDITKSDRVSKEVSDDYTRFTVQKSQISDSGTYFVVARNNNGTDRIFVTVTVKVPKPKE